MLEQKSPQTTTTKETGVENTTANPELQTSSGLQTPPDPRLMSMVVPRSPEEAELAGRRLCPDVVAKFEDQQKTADPEFEPFLRRLEALEPGSGDSEGEAIFKEFMLLARKKNEASGNTESAELRTMYDDKFTPMMAEWAQALEAQGVALEERSQLASMHRTALRELTRKLMSDTVAVAVLRARDLVKYGQGTGPTFDQLFEKEMAVEGTSEAQAHTNIIGSSQRHDKMASSTAKGTG